ncbi:MAG: sigma-70 family RNA polymerase sigma factor [Candidatus Borkfalkiaceae bacterium]|nr:sigma-70 family RNA polymerase sigma factor [Clostridia bacterium]MDY6223544.1 sigma-70 family RNA polymerase sigma factor [Christensenellaceae bacterium]
MTEMNEEELFREYRRTGDVKLRNQLAERYLYIADILAKKFTGRGVDYDDLKQVASLALLRGIDRFNPDLNMQFTTFITPTIAGEIKNYFRDKARMVKLPRKLSEIHAKVRAFCADYEGRTGKKPAVKEIAAALALSEEDVVRALEVGNAISLDSTMAKNDDENDNSLYAVLPDSDSTYERFENNEALKSAMKTLSETERKLVNYRFFESLSQSETAKKLGVSQMFVSRLERKVLAKLKEFLKEA